MVENESKMAELKFKKQREAAIKQKNLVEKQRIQKAIQGKISLAVNEFKMKKEQKEKELDEKMQNKFKAKEARAQQELRKRRK